jgi:uncharacterized membrane protein YfcA
MTILFGLMLGAIVGASLGLIGAGGAILAVPGLVAVLGLSATAATTSSTILGVLLPVWSGLLQSDLELDLLPDSCQNPFSGKYLIQ